ncbi:hypothetical protein N7535_000634 [Penicillium sp. DV-2018c]|nr:hypothetical protein N7461_006114 [Penicillium sp. DV-2018c]KAJ5582014.1 hypothetical protein N7535_000634 [Penicillium sp. DV-2018c]
MVMEDEFSEQRKEQTVDRTTRRLDMSGFPGHRPKVGIGFMAICAQDPPQVDACETNDGRPDKSLYDSVR